MSEKWLKLDKKDNELFDEQEKYKVDEGDAFGRNKKELTEEEKTKKEKWKEIQSQRSEIENEKRKYSTYEMKDEVTRKKRSLYRLEFKYDKEDYLNQKEKELKTIKNQISNKTKTMSKVKIQDTLFDVFSGNLNKQEIKYIVDKTVYSHKDERGVRDTTYYPAEEVFENAIIYLKNRDKKVPNKLFKQRKDKQEEIEKIADRLFPRYGKVSDQNKIGMQKRIISLKEQIQEIDKQLPSLKTGEKYIVDPSQTRGRPRIHLKDEEELQNKINKDLLIDIKERFWDIDIVEGDIWLYHGTSEMETILEKGLFGGDNTKGGTHGVWEEPTLFLTPDLHSAKKYGTPLLIKLTPEKFNELDFSKGVDNAGDTTYILEGKDDEWGKILIDNEFIEEYYVNNDSLEFFDVFNIFEENIDKYINLIDDDVEIEDLHDYLNDDDYLNENIIEKIRKDLQQNINYQRLSESVEDNLFETIETRLEEEYEEKISFKSGEKYIVDPSQTRGRPRKYPSKEKSPRVKELEDVIAKYKGVDPIPELRMDLSIVDEIFKSNYEFKPTEKTLDSSIAKFSHITQIIWDLEISYKQSKLPSVKRKINELVVTYMEFHQDMLGKIEKVVSSILPKEDMSTKSNDSTLYELIKRFEEIKTKMKHFPSLEELRKRLERDKKPAQERI